MARRLMVLATMAVLAIAAPHSQEAAALNDIPDRAETLTLGSALDVTLSVGENGYPRPYYYVLEIPQADANARFDAVLKNVSGGNVQFAWLDPKENTIAQWNSRDPELRFADFVPGAGRHLMKIYPSFEEGVTSMPITLAFERKADWKRGEEREPNENLNQETVGPIADGMSGFKLTDEDREHFAFQVAGPLQLWKITATGEKFDGLALLGANGSEIARAERDRETGVAEMWSVLLPPGRAHFRISGAAGPWSVTATPVGPAPLDVLGGAAAPRAAGEIDEVEPNDGVDRALLLPLGGSRAGQIERDNDADTYRFSLAGPARVRLTLTGPEGMNLRALVSRQNYWEVGRLDASTGPATADFLLGQGDWFVAVRGDKREERPYELKLEPLPWFGPEADLEPNDSPWNAGLLPADFRLNGTLGKVDQEDMFRLPDLTEPATLTVTAAALPRGAGLRVLQETENRSPAGPVKREIESLGDLVTADEGKTYTIALEPGAGRLLRISSYDPGAYALTLAFSTGPKPATPTTTAATLDLSAPAIRAFETRAQRVVATLTLTGAAGETPLAYHLSDDRWRIENPPQAIAGGETKLTLVAPPDLSSGEDMTLSVNAGGGLAEARIAVTADAAPADPIEEPKLPAALLGGLNVAWSSLGGSVGEGYDELIDGYATAGTSEDVPFSDGPTDIVTIDLAGDAPVKLAGFIVNPTVGTEIAGQVRRFTVETSLDGETFTEVLADEVGTRQREYAFPLTAPVEARFVRYRPMTTLNPNDGMPDTGEFKAVATPEAAAQLTGSGFNIADPRLGGYMAWWHGEGFDARHMLDAEDTTYSMGFSQNVPRQLDWVVAFRNQRAARLARIEWQDVADLDPAQAIDAIEIETAMEPNGPWTKAGLWTLDRSAGQPAPFAFPANTWARFVRFNVVLPPYDENAPTLYRREAQQIRIIEQPTDAAGGSILGEWGDFGRQGPYEALNPPAPPPVAATLTGGKSKADARPLPLDAPQPGRASAGAGEVWAVEIPAEGQSLTLTLSGRPLGVNMRLEDANGAAVPLPTSSEDGQTRIATAKVTAGRYYVFVDEPPRSIAVVWDTSGSVGPYVQTIIQSIRSFVRYLTPGRDEVQLMAFDDPEAKALLTEWTGDPVTAFGALNDYGWAESSSNAEGGALGGAHQLAGRPGTRAIILITDYQTGGSYNQRNETLDTLRKTGARVFAFAIPSDSGANEAGVERGLMELLAAVSGGTARYAGTTSDLELAFTRTAAALRAPKDYEIAAAVGFKPPEPGTVAVTVPDDAPPQAKAPRDRAVLVILDASGSMLKKLGKKRRIDIAKDTLHSLTQEMLPEGTPFAMRVFGDTKPDSCETNLRQPLEPLDRAKVKGTIDAITSINKAKTAIGASLAEAASDLGGGGGGQKLIVLITDGEETCDGDPLAEIGRLKDAGLDVRVSVVGFAVDDQALKDTFAEWANAGGGGYFDATRPDELAPAVERALLPSFEIVDAGGAVVATGVAGGEGVSVPPGTYTIRVLSDPVKEYPGVVVESGGSVSVALGQ